MSKKKTACTYVFLKVFRLRKMYEDPIVLNFQAFFTELTIFTYINYSLLFCKINFHCSIDKIRELLTK